MLESKGKSERNKVGGLLSRSVNEAFGTTTIKVNGLSNTLGDCQ